MTEKEFKGKVLESLVSFKKFHSKESKRLINSMNESKIKSFSRKYS